LNNIPVNAQDSVRIHNESAVVANGVISVQRQVDLLNERQVVQAVQVVAGVQDLPPLPAIRHR
jgi:hypothetical protein